MSTPAADQYPSLSRLRDELRGRLILPSDSEYDEARTVVLGSVDRHPAAIAQVADARDVARVIAFAREEGLELAVRSGGHSGAGHGTTEGGIVIDVRSLKDLDIDVASRTAWAGSGLTALEYTQAASAHQLATGFGDTGSVGLGGLILGGGVGYLVRKSGLSIDHLLAAEVVTADGADPAGGCDEPSRPVLGDPRWRRQLRRRDPLPAAAPAARRHRRRDAHAACHARDRRGLRGGGRRGPRGALDDLQRHELPAHAVRARGAPRIARHHRDDLLRRRRGSWPARDRRRSALSRSRSRTWSPRVRSRTCIRPTTPRTGPIASARTLFTDDVDLATASLIIERLAASEASLRAVQLRVLGGAFARVAPDATAFAHRDKRIMANVAAFIDAPEQRAEREAWVTIAGREPPGRRSRRLCELPRGRGRRARPRRLPRGDVGAARRGQAPV